MEAFELKLVLAVYFAAALTISQWLHSYYAARHPKYHGKLSLGFPWHDAKAEAKLTRVPIHRNFAFQSCVVLLFLAFIITIVALRPLPAFGTQSLSEFFFTHFWFVLLPLLAVVSISQMFGPGGLKGWLDAVTIFLVLLALYSGTTDKNSLFLGTVFVSGTPFVFGIVKWWISNMGAEVPRSKYRKFLFAAGLYGFGSLSFVWFVGWLIVLMVFLG
jgi:hypothetical protein